jgi:GNAT superfamily N-acetyltransferase
MEIRYTSDKNEINYEILDELMENVGWETRGQKHWDILLKNATFFVAAFDNDKLVGFVQVFGDGLMWLIIVSLVVHKDYRKRGIATEMLNRIKKFAKDNGYQTLRLFAATDEDPGLTEFYVKNGFEEMNNAMRSKEMPW